MTRWNLSIPDATDRLVRAHLGRKGMKKGDLSNFVAEAVRAAVLRQSADELRGENPQATEAELHAALKRVLAQRSLWATVDEIHERNKDVDPDLIQAEVDEALAWVRAHPAR